MAKVLHRAGGATLLEHVIGAAKGVAPAERIVAVVGHQAERVRAEVAHENIEFALQTEQKGTGHALACAAAPALEAGRLVVVCGDSPLLRPETLRNLVARHEESGCAATLLTTFLDDPYGYGRIVRDEAGHVAAIVEQKAASEEQKKIREINSGMYCFEAALLWPHLAKLTPNPASGEIYLTDIVESLRATGHATAAYVVDDPGEVLGINTRVELAQADTLFRQRKARELMLSGVTIEQPDTVAIDTQVEIGQDTVVGAFTQIRGRTRIGAECNIGAGSILNNATLGDGVEVLPYTLVDDSVLEAGAHAGPFARLRMKSTVEAGAHVGNFVELKNTRLGSGAKSMHLAYLGDSTIGKKTNIGAGTITCNYDGAKKHRTQIGDGSFIGSNSTLVAPVEVGEGAYVGAGSVITDAVPGDALALGRVEDVDFDCAVFTNLQRDHLDFHKDRESYFQAKARLFDLLERSPKNEKCAVINADDERAPWLLKKLKGKVRTVTFGIENQADFRAADIQILEDMTRFTLKTAAGAAPVSLHLLGRHNIYNALAAVAAAASTGLGLKAAVEGAQALADVPGRLERVDAGQDFRVFVDYAHTDAALENVLSNLGLMPHNRIITVFGCGGDRDRTKRAPMGAVACALSDLAIVTSDNPRSEDPMAIIDDIEQGIVGKFTNYEILPDRRDAIEKAVLQAGKGDIVLIAGKGHETYQILKDSTIHFSDAETAAAAIRKKLS